MACQVIYNGHYEKVWIELMGRHREFDTDQALDAIVSVFWRKGFEGTSYADLTSAAGVERPGLYSAFGNKEELFRKAMVRYYERHMNFVTEALQLPTAREVAERILYGTADVNTRYPDHTGCLHINGAIAGSDECESVRKALIDVRAGGEAQIRERFERAKREGDLPENANPDVLATFIMAVTHGMAVQAKAGFSRDKLEAVAEQALSTWPRGRSKRSGKPSKSSRQK